MRQFLIEVMACPERHVKWLNTLSFLENCGARKIAACEHPTRVKEEMLKHAAEEFRHALHLKRQIYRLNRRPPLDYSLPHLLGGMATLHYLQLLEVHICRYLKQNGYNSIQELAYLLMTYAIEMRAAEVYPLYDTLLRERGSKVTVKSILLEEHEHLNEMKAQLDAFPEGKTHAAFALNIENNIFNKWMKSLK